MKDVSSKSLVCFIFVPFLTFTIWITPMVTSPLPVFSVIVPFFGCIASVTCFCVAHFNLCQSRKADEVVASHIAQPEVGVFQKATSFGAKLDPLDQMSVESASAASNDQVASDSPLRNLGGIGGPLQNRAASQSIFLPSPQELYFEVQLKKDGDFKEFAASEMEVLREAYRAGQDKAVFSARGQTYEVYFKRMVQVNTKTGVERAVRLRPQP
eukprot:TRINITY_DN23338_c0_g1_i1.p1 TRINITY_DN23338_c0_g1~~TRINITY_DN23338_c0_g1_i1.p1  ORF type:complete len:212 (-),score=29.96 TRINITY_DN23338_c0_g1_i1:207-842(-)